jgi:hypothetical protein
MELHPKPFPVMATDAATDVAFKIPPADPAIAVNGTWLFFDIPDPAAPMIFAPQNPVVAGQVVFEPDPSNFNDTRSLEQEAGSRNEVMDKANYGTVYVTVADCAGASTGLRAGAGPKTTVTTSTARDAYYLAGASLDAGGVAWFINVPPGSTKVQVLLDGVLVQTATVPVRAATTTVVTFNYAQWL